MMKESPYLTFLTDCETGKGGLEPIRIPRGRTPASRPMEATQS